MDRPTALAYLTQEYTELATDAGFTTQQTTNAYNSALDNALRQLGTAETDLATENVDQTLVLAYIALMEYFTLKRFVRLFAIQFDAVVTGAVEAKRSQKFAQVKQLLMESEMDCQRLGYPVGALSQSVELGRVTLDFLEPSLQGWY